MERVVGITEIIAFYKSVPRNPYEITLENTCKHPCIDPKKIKHATLRICMMLWLMVDPCFGCVYSRADPGVFIDGTYTLRKADAYFDICIYGATFAYLAVGECVIPTSKIGDSDALGFPDITYTNPLFQPVCKSKMPGVFVTTNRSELVLHSNGCMVMYNNVLFGDTYHKRAQKLARAKNIAQYAITEFPQLGVVLLAGDETTETDMIQV